MRKQRAVALLGAIGAVALSAGMVVSSAAAATPEVGDSQTTSVSSGASGSSLDAGTDASAAAGAEGVEAGGGSERLSDSAHTAGAGTGALGGEVAEQQVAGVAGGAGGDAVTEDSEVQLDLGVQRSAPVTLAELTGVGCAYANAGSGEYKDTLCWLDLKGFTTEYEQTRSTIDSRRRFGRTYYSTATVTYQSVLEIDGVRYGVTVTETREASSTAGATAADNAARTAADTAARARLFASDGKVYGPITNFPIEIDLGDGLTLKATVSVSSTGGMTNSGNFVDPSGFPTWPGAFLGNDGFYQFPSDQATGGANAVMPALYQRAASTGSSSTIKLGNIQLLNGGAVMTDYSIVVADAESTDQGEAISWTTSGGSDFSWLPNKPTAWNAATTSVNRRAAAVGNACGGSQVSQWNTSSNAAGASPVCTGASTSVGNKTGTAMLQVSPAGTGGFSVSQTMTGNGLQGVAFGLLTARTQLNLKVQDRIVGSNGQPSTGNFTGSLGSTGAPTPVNTGGTANEASTGPKRLPVSSSGAQLTFSSSTDQFASSYESRWVCEKTPAATGQGRWPTTGYSATAPGTTNSWFKLTPGQFIECTVTYVPPYLKVAKVVDNDPLQGALASEAAVPADWTVSAENAGDSKISQAGDTTRRAVAVGNYTLKEVAAPGSEAKTAGYQQVSLSCGTGSDASLDNQSVSISKGRDVACTYTNRAILPSLALNKAVDNENAGTLGDEKTDWTVKASSSLGNLSGAGSVGMTPVVPGTFALSETGSGASAAGYEWSDLSCKNKDGSVFPVTKNATNGVISNGSLSFGILDLGKEVTCTYTNTAKVGSVKWQKTDNSSPVNYLSGSEWTLGGPGITGSAAVTDCASSPCAAGANKDQDPRAGYFEIKDLKWGDYTLTEMKAPAGHYKLQGPVTFTISGASEADLNKDLGAKSNTKITGPVIPLTGGLGRDFYIAAGFGVILLGTLGLAGRQAWKRRRESI